MIAALVILAAACALAAIATATVLAICALSGRLSRAEEDQALAFSARTPPAAGKAAPAPQASQPPGLAAPPPGHQPRCALCGWHRTWRDCCGWGWVAEICPAHEQRKATP